jgi:hypothetical protein
MIDSNFQLAAHRARQAYTLYEWMSMGAREQSEAIYRELRRIDADFASKRLGRRVRAARLRSQRPKFRPDLSVYIRIEFGAAAMIGQRLCSDGGGLRETHCSACESRLIADDDGRRVQLQLC